jgi:branched-chain amino acid aminotransferase
VPTRVYLSTLDEPVEPERALVSAFDRGFLYGDSIYETMRTTGGVVFELARHLRRLHHSADGLALEIPFSDAAIVDAIHRTLAAAEGPDAGGERRIRVVLTRGGGPMMLDTRRSESPLLVVFVQPLEVPTAEQYEAGISAVIVERSKTHRGFIDPGLKTGNYLPSIMALRIAIERQGDDAILCTPEGNVAEGATSNVFMVERGELWTPHLDEGLLSGITRARVLELAAEIGLRTHESVLSPARLRGADEVFLTSSIRGVMPVTRLDGQGIGGGGMGPVTRRVHEAYQADLAAVAGRASATA